MTHAPFSNGLAVLVLYCNTSHHHSPASSSFKVEVVNLPIAELTKVLTNALQRFVNRCCIPPQEGEVWEHRSKPRVILVSSNEVLTKVIEAIEGEAQCIGVRLGCPKG
jgi:hypothetical protein